MRAERSAKHCEPIGDAKCGCCLPRRAAFVRDSCIRIRSRTRSQNPAARIFTCTNSGGCFPQAQGMVQMRAASRAGGRTRHEPLPGPSGFWTSCRSRPTVRGVSLPFLRFLPLKHRRPKMFAHVSIYQGNPFWVPFPLT